MITRLVASSLSLYQGIHSLSVSVRGAPERAAAAGLHLVRRPPGLPSDEHGASVPRGIERMPFASSMSILMKMSIHK